MSSDEDIPSLGGGRTVWVSSGDHWVFYRELSPGQRQIQSFRLR